MTEYEVDTVKSFFQISAKYELEFESLVDGGIEDPPICVILSRFANDLGQLPLDLADRSLKLIETLLVQGSDAMPEVVATCFLESMANCAIRKQLDLTKISQFLGPKSLEYCRAWDNFNGSKTPGLS